MGEDEPGVIFIFEPHGGSLKRTAGVVEHLELVPHQASTSEEAIAALDEIGVEAALIAHCEAGVELAQYLREFTDVQAPVAALVGQNEADPRRAVEQMTADGFLRRPCTPAALESFLSVGGQLAQLRHQLGEAERTLIDAQSRLRRHSGPTTRSGFHDFEMVKDLLVVEVRRAKRYGYPLAVLMVGLDPLPAGHELHRPNLQREITAGLGVAIAKSIRVIDLPIHYADDRILVFLPHTDLAGAEEVGRRIKRRIKRITYRGSTITAQLTASVGVAGITGGDTMTFSKLIKSAVAALKAAQLKGGDRVMKRVPTGLAQLP